MTYEENINLYNYLKEINIALEKERLYQQHSFDSWLLKICAGVFGVSFAFIDKLVEFTVANWKTLLIASWFLFAFCLVTEIFNFMNSERTYRLDIVNNGNKYMNEAHGEHLPTNLGKKSSKLSGLLNLISFILFFAGVVCLILFVAKNL